MQNSKKCPPNLITFFEDMLNLVFQMGKSEMERKGNFGPSYLSFPVPFRPFQINPAFLSLSEKNGQLSGKRNIAFLSLTCMLKILFAILSPHCYLECIRLNFFEKLNGPHEEAARKIPPKVQEVKRERLFECWPP